MVKRRGEGGGKEAGEGNERKRGGDWRDEGIFKKRESVGELKMGGFDDFWGVAVGRSWRDTTFDD